ELDRGHGIPYKGNYSSWLVQKQERLRQEEKQETQRQKALQREFEWVSQSQKGRQAKSRARLQAYENLLQQDAAKKERELEIFIPPGPRLGDVVIRAKGLTKGFEDKLLMDKVEFDLPPA